MSIKAMKQALEALDAYSWEQVNAARAALRTAIEQAEKPAPVPWSQALESVWAEDDTTPPAATLQDAQPLRGAMPWEQLYPQFERATPPAAQRTWVGLTHEEVKHEWEVWRANAPRYAGFAKGIEAKLKEKNT